jgi:hypothetical protein
VWSRSRSGRRSRARRTGSVADASDDGVYADCGSFLHQDFGQNTGAGRRDFGIYFVGGNLKQRFVAFDAFAGFFEPLGEGSFDNAFAHLGHDDVNHRFSI